MIAFYLLSDNTKKDKYAVAITPTAINRIAFLFTRLHTSTSSTHIYQLKSPARSTDLHCAYLLCILPGINTMKGVQSKAIVTLQVIRAWAL